jgi:Ca-activated chloride channel homolog
MMDELDTLKDLPVPPPSAEAWVRAQTAGLAAFDAAQEKSSGGTQGMDAAPRPISATQSGKRRMTMSRFKPKYALAASLAAVVVGVPVVLLGLQHDPLTSTVSDGLYTPNSDSSQPAKSAPKSESDSGLKSVYVLEPAPISSEDKKSDLNAPASVAAEPQALSDKSVGALSLDLGGAASVNPIVPSPVDQALQLGRVAIVSDDEAAKSTIIYETDGRSVTIQRDARDQHPAVVDNPIKQVTAEPVSTFSIDVDTASYSFARRMLNNGQLPQADAVRVEELINYFPYSYPGPETRDVPFQPSVTIMPAPWNTGHKLVHIGIKGYSLQSAERPRANLVFLMDVSGSMQGPDRLDLVKNAFRLLLDQLKPDDTVGIVTYAGESGIALEPTKASDKGKILAAIDQLGAGGSTAGADGINDAYRLAEAHFDASGVNRIILATDGDFNVGVSDTEALKSLIERKRQSGVFLSILGVGQDNYNDTLMQTLAQNGNGTAAYVDTLNEARKVLVDEASSSLFTIAKDVKIQVEFNPAAVSEYRLIGYETRALKREDFNNDKVDAGDIGSGHTVTALYEITPVGATPSMDDLRYANKPEVKALDAPIPAKAPASEYGFLKLRYKLPKDSASKLLSLPLTPALEKSSVAESNAEVRFATAVAGFGQLLRGSPFLGTFGYDDVVTLAQSAKGNDPFGYRAEFINLARLAKSARP